MNVDEERGDQLAAKCLRLAGIYLIIGMLMGIFMGITRQFAFAPVHAHVNLLGWVNLALASGVFTWWPATAQTRLASAFFLVYNISVPIMMLSLALQFMGYTLELPLVVGSLGVLTGAILFVYNLFVSLPSAFRG